MTHTAEATSFEQRLTDWFFEGSLDALGPSARATHTAHWLKVMCLTGVDYFSTLAEPDPLRRPRVHVG